MLDLLSSEIKRFHDGCLAQHQWPLHAEQHYKTGIWQVIEVNHHYNSLLWCEEDLARRKHVSDSEIAANKRAIDRYNQKRNDATENIDEYILADALRQISHFNGRLNSETAGAMIDRLSILALKIFHMRQQTERSDVDLMHIQHCQLKLEKLIEQRHDLAHCFDQLLNEMKTGQAYYKIYRQFKMYNDPQLNPQLYGAASI